MFAKAWNRERNPFEFLETYLKGLHVCMYLKDTPHSSVTWFQETTVAAISGRRVERSNAVQLHVGGVKPGRGTIAAIATKRVPIWLDPTYYIQTTVVEVKVVYYTDSTTVHSD